jgi:CHAD domain-containing protein
LVEEEHPEEMAKQAGTLKAKIKKLRWDDALGAAGNARELLPGLTRSYFAAGRELLAGATDAESLHRFRLDTKAYRYTVELFQPCYGIGLRERIAALRRLQAYLGLINDYATASQLIDRHLAGDDPDRIKVEALLAARARRKSLGLRRYWRQIVDAPGEERRWCNYLARPRK